MDVFYLFCVFKKYNLVVGGSATPPDSMAALCKSPSWRGVVPTEGWLWLPKNLARGKVQSIGGLVFFL